MLSKQRGAVIRANDTK